MAFNDRNMNSNAHFLSQLYKTDETKRNTQNWKQPFEFQIPRKILEERVKSWDSFFEKYSMEATDAVELNLETLNPEADLITMYEPEYRVPMRNNIVSIQYWVDTGKPPCKVYADENYNSDTGSSLSESELSIPRPAPSPPLTYSLPHPPQPANIPHEQLQRVSSVISSSSVNTREYILSATQLTSKKLSLAAVESIIDSKKSAEPLFNIEDTYVDVCGTDELPKILEQETHIRDATSMLNFQINESERPFILAEMCNKNLPDESPIISLKIGDIIPSLQQIRDGPENYNCNDLYSKNLSSNESDDLIEYRNMNSTTPSLKIDKPVIKVKELGRRKLFTNTQSPIELIEPSSQSCRRFSSNTNLHPALTQYEVIQKQRKHIRKKSLFRPKKNLQDIVEDDKEKLNKGEVKETANNEKNKEIEEKQNQKNDSNLKDKDKIDEPKDDQRLKQRPVVIVERLSKSFIQSYRHKSDDKETRIACASAAINNKFITKKELKIRDLIVSLEQFPRVVIERLPQKSITEETSIKKTLTKDTSTIESSVVPEKRPFTGFNSSSINLTFNKPKTKSIRVFDENETQNQILNKKSSTTKKSFTRKIISFSSDEEGIKDTFEVNKEKLLKPKDLLKRKSFEDGKEKDNFFASNVKISKNLSLKSNRKERNSPPQFNNESTNLSAKFNNKNQTLTQFNNISTSSSTISAISTTSSTTSSSNEDDDFTKCMAYKHFPKESINNKKFSRTYSDVRDSNENNIATVDNVSAKLKTKTSKGCYNDHGCLLGLERVSSEDSSDSENKATFSRNKRKNLKRNFSETRWTNPNGSSKKNFQNSTKTVSDLETLGEENSQSSGNSRILFKTQSEPSIKSKKDLENTKINGSEKAEIIETKKSLIFQGDSDSDSLFDILDFIPRQNQEKIDKASSKIQTSSKMNLKNSTKKNYVINNVSVKLKSKTSKGSDNNLKEKRSRDEKNAKDDKENKNANYEETDLNSFRDLDNGRLLRLQIVSSEDSTDSDDKAIFSRNKRKSLKRNFSETRSTYKRSSSKKNLQNSTKIVSDLETLGEENSQSSGNSRILFKTQSEPSIKSKKDLENTRINGSEKTEIIETKKSLIFRDSDSDSSLDIFDFIPRQNKESTDKASSKIQTPSKMNLQNSTKKNDIINNLSVKLKSKTSNGCDNNLKGKSSRDEKNAKDDKENKNANYEETTLNSFRHLENGRLLRLQIVSSEDSSDSDDKATFSRNKRKSLKRNFSETRSTNPKRSSKKNLQNTTKIVSNLETLEEENSHSSVNSRTLFKTQSEPSIKLEKKHLENQRIRGTGIVEIFETKKSHIFQRGSDSDSSLDILDFIPRQKKEAKEKASSKIQTPLKKLQNNHFCKENVQIMKKIESPLKRSSMFNRKRKKSRLDRLISSDSEPNQSDLKFTNRQAKRIGTFQNVENVIQILPPKRLRKEAEEMNLDSSINIFGDNRNRDFSLNMFESSNDSSEDENTFLQNFNKRLRNRKSNLNFVKKAEPGVKLQMFKTKLFSESDTD